MADGIARVIDPTNGEMWEGTFSNGLPHGLALSNTAHKLEARLFRMNVVIASVTISEDIEVVDRFGTEKHLLD